MFFACLLKDQPIIKTSSGRSIRVRSVPATCNPIYGTHSPLNFSPPLSRIHKNASPAVALRIRHVVRSLVGRGGWAVEKKGGGGTLGINTFAARPQSGASIIDMPRTRV